MSVPHAAQAVILIVTESPAELEGLAHALSRAGLTPRIETRADNAVAALAAGGIAVALIDVALRQRNGFELCTLIKSSAASRDIVVFLMTAAPNPGERQRSSECGACDYVLKPLDAQVVTDKILQQLALKETLVTLPPATMPLPTLRALEVNYHALLTQSPDSVILIELESGRLVDANSNACLLFGLPGPTLLTRTLNELCPPLQPGGLPSSALLTSQFDEVLAGTLRVFETTFQHSNGRAIACEVRLALLPTDGARLMHARIVDITRRTMADRLRAGQTHLLEMIARGAPLPETLDNLVLLIESQSPDLLCSVMLLDADGVTMHSASGPHLPPAFLAALDGVAIGPDVGSCGTAMFLRKTVIVDDVLDDPLWRPYRALVEPFGLRACWSTPIYLDKEHVLGSFAMYYRTVRHPCEDDMRLVAVATHLAGIAIERTRRERELTQHRHHLEVLVAERTAELTRSMDRAEQANEKLAATLDALSLAQVELVRRDKLAALGALVAGVAHELNTPLGNSLVVATTMSDQAHALAAQLGDGVRRSDLDTFLARTEEANQILARNLKRAATLVASFKQLAAGHADAQRSRFNLGLLVEDMLPTMRIAAKSRSATLELKAEANARAPSALAVEPGVEVNVTLSPGLDMDSFPGPLTEVLTSLFDNCLLHAFDEARGGMIRISAAPRDGGLIAIEVRDDGVGIPAAIADRVYDPFFTTKLGSGGSGLGLHVVHNAVTGILGGRIELFSEPGEGTRFTVLLPAVAPSATVEAIDAESDPVHA